MGKRGVILVTVLAAIFVGIFLIRYRADSQRESTTALVRRNPSFSSEQSSTPPGVGGSGVPQHIEQLAQQEGLSVASLLKIKQELSRLDKKYDDDLGITLPDSYRAITDRAELERLIKKGDRYAATRLGQVLIEGGDADGAVQAYRKAAELGSAAPLAEVAMLLDPGNNGSKDFLSRSGFPAPVPDLDGAYIAASVAYLRGYGEAYYALDRIRRQVPSRRLAELDGRATVEYIRLADLYNQRFGRYPSVQVSPLEQMRNVGIFQSNFMPRPAANPGGNDG